MDILATLKQWEEHGVTSSLEEHAKDLELIKEEIQSRINSANKEIFLSKPKFLPQDVREEMIGFLMDWDKEGVEGCDYCPDDDRSKTSDDELIEEYKYMFLDEEDDELLQKSLGYQVEYKLLTGK